MIGEKGLLSQEPFRKVYDGVTYFGCKKSVGPSYEISGNSSIEGSLSLIEEATGGLTNAPLNRKQKQIVNDFIIPVDKKEER